MARLKDPEAICSRVRRVYLRERRWLCESEVLSLDPELRRVPVRPFRAAVEGMYARGELLRTWEVETTGEGTIWMAQSAYPVFLPSSLQRRGGAS